MTKAQFYGLTLPQLIDEGITVKLVQRSSQDNCIGWFDEETKEFGCCLKQEEFFNIYLHEYCHFLQWRDDPDFFRKAGAGITILTHWLKKRRKSGQNGRVRTQLLELDAERRALRLIKKYKLPVDVGRFCQRANVCLFGYLLVEKNKKWPKYFYTEKIMSYFPKRLLPLGEYGKLRNIPKEARELMEQAFK